MSKQRALILLHEGFEEIEAVTPIDLLSRAGVEVIQTSLSSKLSVTGRSGITIAANHFLQDVSTTNYDLVILPGGPGIMKLRQNIPLCDFLKNQLNRGSKIACICAAPLILLDAGLLSAETRYTAHPSTAGELPDATSTPVVVDGAIITSTGAGTATEFSLELVRQLAGNPVAKEIADAISWQHAV
ncbi:MAG: DJ-1 family glyoxalase III [Verrucomicrobiota bacterium]